jgi:hypothetical protein
MSHSLNSVGATEVYPLQELATTQWDGTRLLAEITLTGNRTISLPSPLQSGVYVLIINQDTVGSRTVTWASGYEWVDGSAPTLTTTASSTDVISFVSDGNVMRGVAQLNFS